MFAFGTSRSATRGAHSASVPHSKRDENYDRDNEDDCSDQRPFDDRPPAMIVASRSKINDRSNHHRQKRKRDRFHDGALLFHCFFFA
jgi:hypothetical protein